MNIHVRKSDHGFSLIGTVLGILIVVSLAVTGLIVWRSNNNPSTTSTSNKQSTALKSTDETTNTDASDSGKHLVIKEWGTKVMLPPQLIGKVAYDQILTTTDPDSGLPLQATKIYIAKSALDDTAGDCAVTNTSLGDAVATGAQYIRSDTSKPFNASRYKGTMKANILISGQYAYHLSYIIPDCLGGVNQTLDSQLLTDLEELKSAS